MSPILLPIPSRDFDPTEVAVSWKILTQHGHRVVFATPDGEPGACDPIMLSGIGLDPWSGIPVLRHIRILGYLLSANGDARNAYAEMLRDPAFKSPMRWDRIESKVFGALLLGGGHRARGMREYLESIVLQRITAEFFADEKPVGAICHGVVLAARSKRRWPAVLYGRKPRRCLGRWNAGQCLAHVGRFWDRNYYRTYTEATGATRGIMLCSRRSRAHSPALRISSTFPRAIPSSRKTSGTARDTVTNDRRLGGADENYVSARWPATIHSFASTFAEVLKAWAS